MEWQIHPSLNLMVWNTYHEVKMMIANKNSNFYNYYFLMVFMEQA